MAAQPAGVSTTPPSLVSPANLLRVHSNSSSRSLMKKLNKTGPSTDPWGTPRSHEVPAAAARDREPNEQRAAGLPAWIRCCGKHGPRAGSGDPTRGGGPVRSGGKQQRGAARSDNEARAPAQGGRGGPPHRDAAHVTTNIPKIRRWRAAGRIRHYSG